MSPKSGKVGKYLKLASGDVVNCVTYTNEWATIVTAKGEIQTIGWPEVVRNATDQEGIEFELKKVAK